ncbi:protein kinase [Micromonospora sp. CPCC 206060]|uniref:serine/threonine-protein kinase n=1 Tax=Micromonospora sp. CPCC 206060 TaxID=3122406 RepID=UPI002FF0E434
MTQIPTWSGGPVNTPTGRAAPGTTIGGRYSLRSAVGNGGMGTVWRATDTLLRREVAVKEVVLPPGLAPSDRDAMYERTLREARAAAALQHPAVVQVYDVVTEGGRPWIVMELLDARSLADMVIEDGPLAPRAVAKIGIALLGALEVAHAHGVLHRDVKPANVLICSDGRCVLTDFGVARMPTDVQLTTPGMVLGSPHFISPERAMGQDFGPPSDFFSLGVTLYTAVEGRPPFDRGDPIETMHAVVEDPPAAPTRCGPLTGVLMGLLEKDPARRLDVHASRAMLRELLAGPLASKAPANLVTDPYAVVPVQRVTYQPPVPIAEEPKPSGQIGGRAMIGPGESLTDRLAALRRGERPAQPETAPGAEAALDETNPDGPAAALDTPTGAMAPPSRPARKPATDSDATQQVSRNDGPVADGDATQQVSGAEPTQRIGGPEPTQRIGSPEPTQRIGSPEPTQRIGSPEPTQRIGSPEPTQRISRQGTAGQFGGATGGQFGAATQQMGGLSGGKPAGPAPAGPAPIAAAFGGARGGPAPVGSLFGGTPGGSPAPATYGTPGGSQWTVPGTGQPWTAPGTTGGGDGPARKPAGISGVLRTVQGWPRKVQLAAAGGVAVLLLIGVFALSGGSDEPPPPPQAGPPSATAPAATAPEMQQHSARGISMLVPKGWNKTTGKSYTDYIDPEDPGRKVRIITEDFRTTSMRWAEVAENGLQTRSTSCVKPYKQLAMTEVELAGKPAAEFEYNCGEGDTMRHGVWRGVVTGGKAYSFYLTSTEAKFAESKPIFDEMVKSFQLTSAN